MHNSDIGDISSNEKGTGLRYNSNKIPYEVLPVKLLLEWISDTNPQPSLNPDIPQCILKQLSLWQNGVDQALDSALVHALNNKLHLTSFAEAAHVFQHVTIRQIKPYPLWNWKKGMPWIVPLGCALRHTLSEINGIEFDEETGFSHRAHTICNLVMLLEFRENYQEGDNRWTTL